MVVCVLVEVAAVVGVLVAVGSGVVVGVVPTGVGETVGVAVRT